MRPIGNGPGVALEQHGYHVCIDDCGVSLRKGVASSLAAPFAQSGSELLGGLIVRRGRAKQFFQLLDRSHSLLKCELLERYLSKVVRSGRCIVLCIPIHKPRIASHATSRYGTYYFFGGGCAAASLLGGTMFFSRR